MFNSLGDNFPTIFFCLCCGIIVIPTSILIIYIILKSRKESWSGVIVKKNYVISEDSDGNKQDNYSFEVKMDDGSRNRNVAVSQKLYSAAKEGDKIKKDRGKLIPELIK